MYKDIAVSSVRGSLQAARDLIQMSFVSINSNVLSPSVFREISSLLKEYPSHQQQSILSYKDAIEMQYSEMEYNIQKSLSSLHITLVIHNALP